MATSGTATDLAEIASLFSSCVSAWGFLSARRSFKHEFALQQTKLDVEKTLFLQWGRRLGIVTSAHERHPVVDPRVADGNADTLAGIRSVLGRMRMLLTDYDELRLRYGITLANDEDGADGNDVEATRVSHNLMQDIDDWQRRFGAPESVASLPGAIRWICPGRDKFIAFVNELNFLNGRLYSLAPPVRFVQQVMVQQLVDSLRDDLPTLHRVRAATEQQHRDWSDAASQQIALSEAGERSTSDGFEHVRRWQQAATPSESGTARPPADEPVPEDLLALVAKVATDCMAFQTTLKSGRNSELCSLGLSGYCFGIKVRVELQRANLATLVLSDARIAVVRTCILDLVAQVSAVEDMVKRYTKYDPQRAISLVDRDAIMNAMDGMVQSLECIVRDIPGNKL